LGLVKNTTGAIFNGFSQLVFLENRWAGMLVLSAIFIISPWSAIYALIGSLVGVAVSSVDNRWSQHEWISGISSYNLIILGIFWSGILSHTFYSIFILMMFFCVVIDAPIRRFFESKSIPPLSVAAVISGIISQWIFDGFDLSFWFYPALFPFGKIFGWLAVLIIVLIWLNHSMLLLVSISLSISAYSISWVIIGDADVGLWAFTVAFAATYPLLFFSSNKKEAIRSSVVAVMFGSSIWWLWSTYLTAISPPLLMPMMLGIWFSLLVVYYRSQTIAQDEIKQLAKLIFETYRNGQTTIVLTGAGMSTASGIPDYVSAEWLDSEVPVSEYSYSRFINNSIARSRYWSACSKFRKRASLAHPNPGHFAVSWLEKNHLISNVITQNVDGLHQLSGSKNVIEIHGNINKIHCIQCGAEQPWPKEEAWIEHDILCPLCDGLLKPHVVAMGENISIDLWHSSVEAVSNCGCLIVAGSRLAVSPVSDLVRVARDNNVKIVVVNQGDIEIPLIGDNEYQIVGAIEEVLPSTKQHLSRYKQFKKDNTIKVVVGDITNIKVDAIVTAANSTLLGGSGVDGAIHRAAGPRLLEETRKIGGCPAGEARITKGFDLKSKWVIHAVGPIWRGGDYGEARLLEDVYRYSFELALDHGVKSIAFPLISTGAYGYPKDQAASIASQVIRDYKDRFEKIIVCAFDELSAEYYTQFR